MNVEQTKAQYRRDLTETVSLRRYSGVGGSRTHVDYASLGRVIGCRPEQIVGLVQQGDSRAIVYADTLVANGLTLPVTTADKLVFNNKELAIIAVDDKTRCINGVLIALVLQVRG